MATLHRAADTVPSLLRAAWAGLDPEGCFRHQATRATPFTLRFPGLGTVLFVATMAGARDILMAPAELCEAPRPSLIEPIVGAESLILLSGDHHRRIRGLVAPALRAERTRSYASVIADATTEAIEDYRPGDRIAVRALAQAITLDVIIRLVFGITDRDRRHTYAELIGALMRANTAPLMLVPALRRGFAGHGPWPRLVGLRDQLDLLLSEDITRRRDSGRAGGDMLDLLLDATDEHGHSLGHVEICQQLRTLLAAGHETTATALTWAMYHIYRDDDVRCGIVDELASTSTASDIAELPYLRAVIDETLRLHPTVSVVLRRLRGPLTVAGVACTAGDTVGIALPALHSNPELWPDPGRFDPARFLGERPSPFAFAPFGGGYRRCIGAAFAKCELAVTIGTILNTLQLRMADRHRRPPRAAPSGIAAGPNRSVMLEVVDRVPGGVDRPRSTPCRTGGPAVTAGRRRSTGSTR